jgi:uncharacterized protein YjbI with pentapeptide repeats
MANLEQLKVLRQEEMAWNKWWTENPDDWIDLSRANLFQAQLVEANLRFADLSRAILVETNLERATLNGCKIYGTSAWNLKLYGAKQNGLIITPINKPTITVDNLEVAQFIYFPAEFESPSSKSKCL